MIKIPILIALIGLCVGEPLSAILHPKKITTSYINTTPRTMYAMHEPHTTPYTYKDAKRFWTMQYAPLYTPNSQYTTISSYKATTRSDASSTSLRKDHLEPKFPPVKSDPLFKVTYIPGHNVEVKKLGNRFPGHNAVYKSYDENSNEKRNKINYLRQYIINPTSTLFTREHEVGLEKTTSKTRVLQNTSVISSISDLRPIPREINSQLGKPLSLIPSLANSSALQSKIPYPKLHALFLNVARTYAFVPTGLHSGANPAILGTSVKPQQLKPLIKVPGSSKLEPVPPAEKKTVMFPIQKNRHFSVHS